MLFHYEVIGNSLVVKLNGELDHHVSEQIREDLEDTIEKKRIKHLIFDLKELHFMDSSGIGMIMGRYKSVSKQGGKVAIINASEKVDKIFMLSGLYRIVTKYNSLDEAIKGM